MTATGLWAAMFSILSIAGTELKSDGKVLFQASERVTFGATYAKNAVRATLVSPKETAVTVRVSKPPVNLFVNQERAAKDAWSYDADSSLISFRVPAGRTSVQIRFDSLESIKPFAVSFPLQTCSDDWKDARDAALFQGECASESVTASATWDGEEGVYVLRAVKGGRPAVDEGVALAVRGAVPFGVDGQFLLAEGSVIDVTFPAPGNAPSADAIQIQLKHRLADAKAMPRDQLDWEGSVVVEGEDFSAEGGGEVSKSTAHGNTHKGACIYAWANAGHWISWTLPVPKAGPYALTVITASQEKFAVRSIAIDGVPLKNAGLVRFPGTGGWGRSNASEWQPFQPMDKGGRPVAITLTAGDHELKMTNTAGQHMNVDCIILTPLD